MVKDNIMGLVDINSLENKDRICFRCSNAFVTDEDKLYCIEKQRIVNDEDSCSQFN